MASMDFRENQVQYALQGDVLKATDCIIELNPIEMEEWAKRVQDPVSHLEFVRKVNDPDFLPVDEMWRKKYEGWPPVRWWVGVGKDHTRVICATSCTETVNGKLVSVLPKEAFDTEGIRAKFLVALGETAPSKMDVTVDSSKINVMMRWC
jgi:hypothetical protein